MVSDIIHRQNTVIQANDASSMPLDNQLAHQGVSLR